MVSVGLNSRLACFQLLVIRATWSTPGITSMISGSSFGNPTPITPMTVRSAPLEVWPDRPISPSRLTMPSTCSSVESLAITMITGASPSDRSRELLTDAPENKEAEGNPSASRHDGASEPATV